MDDDFLHLRTFDDDSLVCSCSDITGLSSSNHSGCLPSSSVTTSNTESVKADNFSVPFAVRYTSAERSTDGALPMKVGLQLAWVLVLHQFFNHANETVDIVEAHSTVATDSPPDVSRTLRLPSTASFNEPPLNLWKALTSAASSVSGYPQKTLSEASLICFAPSKITSKDAAEVMHEFTARAETSGVCLSPSLFDV